MSGWDVFAGLVILGLVLLCQWLVWERGRLLRLVERLDDRLAVGRHFQAETDACIGRMGDEAMRREAALRDAVAERDACHGLFAEALRALGHDPESGHPGIVDAAKRAAAELERLRQALRAEPRDGRPIGEVVSDCGFFWPDDDDARRNVLESVARTVRWWRGKCHEAESGVQKERAVQHAKERAASLARKLRNVRKDAMSYRRAADWHAHEQRGTALRLLAGEDVGREARGELLERLAERMRRLRELEERAKGGVA